MALNIADSKSDIQMNANITVNRPFSEPPPYPGTRSAYSHAPTTTCLNKFTRNDAKQSTDLRSSSDVRKTYIPLGDIVRNVPNQIGRSSSTTGAHHNQTLVPGSAPSSFQNPSLYNQHIQQIPQQNCPIASKEDISEEMLSQANEEELMTLSVPVLVKHLMDTQNRISFQTSELKGLKSSYQRLQEDNQELRDLCCFLDDDRQKGRKLAREWQRFGRYTASVMRQEVASYQTKLKQLEFRQQEMVKDNNELKELCLYLDEERLEMQQTPCPSCGVTPSPPPIETVGLQQPVRDEGDGSSSSTNADEPHLSRHRLQSLSNIVHQRVIRTASQDRLLDVMTQTQQDHSPQRSILAEQLLQYTRQLELRISQLEEERSSSLLSSRRVGLARPAHPPPYNAIHNQRAVELGIRSDDLLHPHMDPDHNDEHLMPSRPEAITRALRVLQVRELLEPSSLNVNTTGGRSSRQRSGLVTPDSELADEEVDRLAQSDEALGDGERALVHAMCNVVWRKLEEAPSL